MIGIALGVAWLCCLAFFCGVLVAEKDRGWSCLDARTVRGAPEPVWRWALDRWIESRWEES